MTILAKRTVGQAQIAYADADPNGIDLPIGSIVTVNDGTLWISQGGTVFTQITGGAEVLAMSSLFNDTGLPVDSYGFLGDGFYQRKDLTLGSTQNLWLPQRVATGTPVVPANPVLCGWFTGSETPPTNGATVQGMTATITGSSGITSTSGYWRLNNTAGNQAILTTASGQLGSNVGVYIRMEIRFSQTGVSQIEIHDGANTVSWGQSTTEVYGPRSTSGSALVGVAANLRNLGLALPTATSNPTLIEIVHDGRTGITTCYRDGFLYGTAAIKQAATGSNFLRIQHLGASTTQIRRFIAVTFTV
jgi:hypothetical protein